MKAVVQRVNRASVEVDKSIISSISKGFLILLGIHKEDTDQDLEWLVAKIAKLRVFSDSEGKMNLPIGAIQGEIIVVSQFTLIASTKKGNRPSFIDAAKPDQANLMYEKFMRHLAVEAGVRCHPGKFAADMKVDLVNDGPVTILYDTHNKE